MWDKVSGVRQAMRVRGMRKATGGSVIEINGRIREFDSGHKSHTLQVDLCAVLWSLSMISKSSVLVVSTILLQP